MDFIFSITDFSNAAMVDNPGGEVSGMLQAVAAEIASGNLDGQMNLRDANGNKVGHASWDLTPDDEGSTNDDDLS